MNGTHHTYSITTCDVMIQKKIEVLEIYFNYRKLTSEKLSSLVSKHFYQIKLIKNNVYLDILKNKFGIKKNIEMYDLIRPETPILADTVEWLDETMDASTAKSKQGKWFYNIRDTNKDGEIVRVFERTLLEKIKNRENPYTRKKWDFDVLARFKIKSISGSTSK